jgi:hypothetical protein
MVVAVYFSRIIAMPDLPTPSQDVKKIDFGLFKV